MNKLGTNQQLPLTDHSRQHCLWRYWFIVPLYPYGERRTLRQEVIQDQIWTFDQLQGFLYAVVPIRMTVIKLQQGGLLIYAPIAPTAECLQLVNELVAQHGEVKYIILPTASGLEHKVFVGPFARCFPQAQVYAAPSQWSFPFNLPLSWLGFPAKRTHILPQDWREAPFKDDFEYAILEINLGRGSFVEVAFFHKLTQSLLLTDTVVSIPEMPPAIVQLDPYPLLFHARESALDAIVDTEINRRKGWKRISLFAFYFRPSAIAPVAWRRVLREMFQAPDRSRKAYFGLFPFQWSPTWEQSFEALRGGGRPFVAPILQTLILDHAPKTTLAWADQVARWPFQRMIPCHFEAPFAVTPSQFRQAFTFLETSPTGEAWIGGGLPSADLAFLLELEAGLNRRGITRSPEQS